MNDFEKVEKLREKANVSYEEAKAALEKANGDILDAMIILENEGKVYRDGNSSYSTKPEYGCNNLPVVAESGADEDKKENKEPSEFARKMKALLRKLWVNNVVISHKESDVIKMPLWIFLLIVLIGIEVVPIIILVSLFLGFKYSFGGEDEFKTVNEAAGKVEKVAGDIVDVVKDGYEKL